MWNFSHSDDIALSEYLQRGQKRERRPASEVVDGSEQQNNVNVTLENCPHCSRDSDFAQQKKWIGAKLWEVLLAWEREHIELVLENTQSVARDHLGTTYHILLLISE